MTDDVSTGEIMRRLDVMSKQMSDMLAQLAAQSAANQETFARKDVLDVRLSNLDRAVRELDDDRDKQLEKNRQFWIVIIGAIATGLVTLLISLLMNHAGV